MKSTKRTVYLMFTCVLMPLKRPNNIDVITDLLCLIIQLVAETF